MTTLDALQAAARERALPRLGYFRLRAIVSTTVAVVAAIIFIWPFLCMLGQSFNRVDVYMNPLWPIPARFTTALYEAAVTRYHFDRYIWNSVQVVFASTALNVFACALAGYTLAKCEFSGRNLPFGAVLAIMLLPSQTMLVPTFVVMRQLNLVNNYWGLILPAIARLNNLTVADPFARPAVIAASIVAALLPLGLYAYSQRYFMATLAGAIKG